MNASKTDLNAKYDTILSQERAWARGVALAAMKQRPITVWEVMIPIFILFNYMRLKGAREVFAQNLLYTKKLALKAAFAMVKNALNREDAMSPVREETQELLASVKDGIYSEKIRQKQLQEIDLLIDHYSRLLKAEGKDYASLLVSAYWSQKDYEAFLVRLKGAESEVNLAAVETLGTQADREMLSRIERASERIRQAGAQRIFQPTN
ncbi:MAG: NF038143 family protein [Desulfobacteraceae bacterium]|jgi:hypothetical protein